MKKKLKSDNRIISGKFFYVFCIIIAGVLIVSSGKVIYDAMSDITEISQDYNVSSDESESVVSEKVYETTETEEITVTDKKENLSQIKFSNIKKLRSDIYDGDLLLINNKREYRYTDTKDGIVDVIDYKSSSYSLLEDTGLRENVVDALNNMIDDFYLYNEYNDIPADIFVKSGYRLVSEQGLLYNSELEKTGLKSSNKIAKPGSSEHHTGYALDLGIYGGEYTGKGVYKWINDSCYRYGFIVRYKENKSGITGFQSEPWHFRYVGIPHAYAIEVNGLCFEEYIKLIKKFTPERPLTINAEMGRQYQVYYVKAQDTETDIPVPENSEYSISGNNVDGFIITVDGIFNENGCDNINVSENENVSSYDTESISVTSSETALSSDTENIPITSSETDIPVSESEIQTGD